MLKTADTVIHRNLETTRLEKLLDVDCRTEAHQKCSRLKKMKHRGIWLTYSERRGKRADFQCVIAGTYRHIAYKKSIRTGWRDHSSHHYQKYGRNRQVLALDARALSTFSGNHRRVQGNGISPSMQTSLICRRCFTASTETPFGRFWNTIKSHHS